MKSKIPRFTANYQGFTLVELMITLVMSGIIVAAIYSAYIIQQKTYYTQGQVVEMQQNIRAGLEMMSSEIRMAGYDPGGEAGAGILEATGSKIRITMDLNNDNDVLDTNEDVTYEIAGGKLTRTPRVGAAQAVAEGIQSFESYYTLDGGIIKKLDPTVTQLPQIKTVQITMLAIASQRDPKYTNTETYTTGSGASWGPFNDNFRRRLLTSSVNLRNQGLNK